MPDINDLMKQAVPQMSGALFQAPPADQERDALIEQALAQTFASAAENERDLLSSFSAAFKNLPLVLQSPLAQLFRVLEGAEVSEEAIEANDDVLRDKMTTANAFGALAGVTNETLSEVEQASRAALSAALPSLKTFGEKIPAIMELWEKMSPQTRQLGARCAGEIVRFGFQRVQQDFTGLLGGS